MTTGSYVYENDPGERENEKGENCLSEVCSDSGLGMGHGSQYCFNIVAHYIPSSLVFMFSW